jgi:glycosyltransferase involved in cell wall biosynthesis
MLSISVVIPVYNERENVPLLYGRLLEVLETLHRDWEILFVDDGSRDGTDEELARLAARDHRVKVVQFRRNFGQTAAMEAGFQMASGDVIVTMDGDLQNEPADIPMMLAKIDEGYDLVHGWRKQRHDAFLNRRLPSMLANWIISRTTRFPIRDLGCTLKAIRREIAQELELYGEMHRFIPILAHARGARCCEVVTRHHARQHGRTKYGISRTFRVILDLITVKYMLDYFASPMKLFGKFGLLCGGMSLVAGLATLAMKGFQGIDMTGNPLLLLTALTMMISVQFFSLGLIGEVAARIYYGSQGKQHYAMRKLANFQQLTPLEAARRRRHAA